MGSKNKSMNTTWLIVAVIVMAIALVAVAFNVGDTETTGAVITEAVTESGDNEFCANNPGLDGKVRIRDGLATTKSYLNATLLVQNKDTGSIVESSVTGGGTTSFTTLSNLFDCKSKTGYDVFIKGTGTANSDGKAEITPEMLKQDPVEFEIVATQYTPYKVKCYDEDEKAKCYDNAGSQAFVTSLASRFNASDATSWSTSVNDEIDITLTIQPNVSNQAKGKGLMIAINTEDESNLDDFDETLTQVWLDGVAISEATGLSENELRAVNAYEHIYVIDETVGMNTEGNKKSETELRIKLKAEADASTKSFDPVIKIIALGDYESENENVVLENVGFRDDSSRTELYTAQTITLTVGAVGANS